MKYFTIFLTLFTSITMTSCNWFSSASSSPYTVHHDFEVHCKRRVGTPLTKVSAEDVVIRIDPTKMGNGQEWDEFQIEVQEKITNQNGSFWQSITATPWLNYPQSLTSIQQSPNPNQEYLVDFKNKLDDPSKFKTPGGVVNGGINLFNYRLVLKGKWNNGGTPVITQMQKGLVIEVHLMHTCTTPMIGIPPEKKP